MENKITCSLCERFPAVTACKCQGRVSFFGSCCLQTHLQASIQTHEQIPIYLAKYLLFRKSFQKINEIYATDCKELTESLVSYQNQIRSFKEKLRDLGNSLNLSVCIAIEKSSRLLNSIDKEIQLKLGLLKAHSERPVKEGITLIHTFKEQKLKGVLNSYTEFMIYNDAPVLRALQNMIHISNEPYAEEEDRLQAQIRLLKSELQSRQKIMFEKQSIIQSQESQAQDLNNQISSLTSQIESLQKSLSTQSKSISEFETRISRRNIKIQDLKCKLDEAVKLISSKEEFMEMYKEKLNKLEIKNENAKAKISCLQEDLNKTEEKYIRDMAKSRQAKEENMELISALKEDISQLLKQVQELTDENSLISRKNSELEENLRRSQMLVKAVQPKDLSYYLSNRIV
jgi:chromosome segregation ATPase